MGRMIVKLPNDKLLMWSTVVDAPVTYAVSREEFVTWYLDEYGTSSADELNKRMARADATGSSSMIDADLESVIAGNRAGPNETTLTLDEIMEQYDHDLIQAREAAPKAP